MKKGVDELVVSRDYSLNQFYEIPPYTYNPVAGALYMGLKL
ncbi:hypothetical protein MKX78_01550 [Cytobacillus sp. FSL R5-0569]|nr:hypothetical protein [Cytobacillus kochii]MDQ0185618.1 hypothetical protein [Cytobacillus kochii]